MLLHSQLNGIDSMAHTHTHIQRKKEQKRCEILWFEANANDNNFFLHDIITYIFVQVSIVIIKRIYLYYHYYGSGFSVSLRANYTC